MSDDIAHLTLAGLASAIRRRKLSSHETTMALLARIRVWQPVLNAFIAIDEERALKSARAADRALARDGKVGP
ncbi:MAG: amidase, partial [Rhizobiales bacterium]|nr:amidase [Hyphomicrobiales bacterium]